MTGVPLTATAAEAKVHAVLTLIADSDVLYKEVAEQVRLFAPAVLTFALGRPVTRGQLTELAEALDEAAAGEDGPSIRYWERRAADLMAAMIPPPAAPATDVSALTLAAAL